ncbi:hypothetical protein DERF_010386 [Dermatophagoides farinae]|uniref:Uncharacterized protein n=1 Tax=Dermatophagoides farinae TaxID=6954 RepID=A0A922HYA7_DERFA|nr:hypothetical protein HUG17_0335 [Dermatophagoides farinae]KAH9511968.1 hypothetical protein DERF_010386 [Dermatophagoides farinae]
MIDPSNRETSEQHDQAMIDPPIHEISAHDQEIQEMIAASEIPMICDNEQMDSENQDYSNSVYDDPEELETIQEIFKESFDFIADSNSCSYYSSNIAILPDDEKKFIDKFLAELIQVKVNKSIPDKHVVEIGNVIAKYFIKAREKKNMFQI